MKILITGNLGYVGPVVVRRLRTSFPDAELIGYDTGYFAHCLTGTRLAPETLLNAQFFGDVRDLPLRLFEGVDALVQLAAISNDPMGKAFEVVTREINFVAGVAAAARAKEAGVKRIVFASSCSVYGAGGDAPRTEESELAPLTAYARSKVDQEKAIQHFASAKTAISCLRFATACGMSDRLRLDLVLNDFVASALAKSEITVLSDGSPWRPLIHVEDMARAIEWGITRDIGAGGEYLVVNVGSDDWNYQIKDLAHAVAEEIPGVRVSINTKAAPDNRSYRVDFEKFASLAPHHQPKVRLHEAVQGLKSGLQSLGFADGNFRDSDFIRLQVLSGLQKSGHLDRNLRWQHA